MKPRLGRRGKAVLLVTAGLIVGYVIGPPLVHAATTIVTIQGTGSTRQAKVTSDNRLYIDTEANKTTISGSSYLLTDGFASTIPTGELLLASGTGPTSLNPCGFISAVIVDGTGVGSMTIKDNASGTIYWQGSLGSSGGHIGDTFENELYYTVTLNVIVTGSPQYEIYGTGGLGCGLNSHSLRPHVLRTASGD